MDTFKQQHLDYIDVLDKLTQPQYVTNIQGMNHLMEPVTTQIIHATGNTTGGIGNRNATYGAKSPIWTAAYDWCTQITTTINKLAKLTHQPQHRTITEVLAHAYTLPLAPEHTTPLQTATNQLQHQHRQALRLIFPPMFDIIAPCPTCGATTTTQHNTDGHTTAPAITVHEMWAECAACGYTWEGADVLTLATQIDTTHHLAFTPHTTTALDTHHHIH